MRRCLVRVLAALAVDDGQAANRGPTCLRQTFARRLSFSFSACTTKEPKARRRLTVNLASGKKSPCPVLCLFFDAKDSLIASVKVSYSTSSVCYKRQRSQLDAGRVQSSFFFSFQGPASLLL